MWFRNLRPFRMTRGIELAAEQLEEKLAQRPFRPCSPAQPLY